MGMTARAKRNTCGKDPWFDEDLREMKKSINRYSRWLNKHPGNNIFREKLFNARKSYKKVPDQRKINSSKKSTRT